MGHSWGWGGAMLGDDVGWVIKYIGWMNHDEGGMGPSMKSI